MQLANVREILSYLSQIFEKRIAGYGYYRIVESERVYEVFKKLW